MIKHEGISWILDRPHTEVEELQRKYRDRDVYLKHYYAYTDEKYKQNIDFVHSLGLKCDCVGWCSLDFDRPDIDEILDKVEKFCKENGWLARGGYGCRYTDFESDWYEIRADDVDDIAHNEGTPYGVYAYKHRNKPFLLGWCYHIPALVSERFRQVCIENDIPDIDFCWAKDVGRYDSIQYAFMYPKNKITRIASGRGLTYNDEYIHRRNILGKWVYVRHRDYKRHDRKSKLYKRLQQIGGYLPRLAEIFYNFSFNLQDYYFAKDLPETGFVYIQGYNEDCRRDTLLVHKDTAEILLRGKVLDPKTLYPVLICDEEIPAGYVETIIDNRQATFDPELAKKMEEEYQRIKSIKRPQRKATTNMALKALREAKRERKEEFGKRMRKELAEALLETAYAPLSPYYLAANGGCLNDEYQFLDYSASKEYTLEFEEDMGKEELVEIPGGIVFCKCTDGDRVILTQEGNVLRVSHEVPEVLEEWPSLAQFFVDSIESV